MTLNFKIVALILLLACAWACGGGAVTNDGVRMVTVEGSINDVTYPSKGLQAASGTSALYTARAVNLDKPSEVWPVQVYSDETYSVNIIRLTNLKIEVFRSQNLVFSRLLSRSDTQSSLQSTKINSVTHIQAQMIEAAHFPGADWSETATKVNTQVFGIAQLQETQFVMPTFVNKPLAGLVAIYGQLFRSSGDVSFGSLVTKFNGAFAKSSAAEVLSSYKQAMSQLSNLEAQALASAHEGAKNNFSVNTAVPASHFDELKRGITGEVVLAFQNSLQAPYFTTAQVPARQAAPGMLFAHLFPTASSNDILGISRYEGRFSNNVNPIGPFRNDLEEGKKLLYLPSVHDQGKTFRYEFSVFGVNGKVLLADNIQIKVMASAISALDRKMLTSIPLVGPRVFGSDLFLVSISNSGLEKYIEKFDTSYIINGGADLVAPSFRWTLPTAMGNVYDMFIRDKIVYLAAGDKGIVGYDTNFLENVSNTFPAKYSNTNIKAVQMVVVNDRIYALEANGNVQRTSLLLSGNVQVAELNENLKNTPFPALSSLDEKVLIASSNTFNYPYILNASGNLIAMVPYTTAAQTPLREARALEWNPITYVGSANFSQVSFLAYQVGVGDNVRHAFNLNAPLLTNGTYLYSVASDNITVRADALSSNVHSGNTLSSNAMFFIESTPRLPLYFNSLPPRVGFELSQPSTGLNSQQSGAYLFTIGKTTDVTLSGNWGIRAHKIESVSP